MMMRWVIDVTWVFTKVRRSVTFLRLGWLKCGAEVVVPLPSWLSKNEIASIPVAFLAVVSTAVGVSLPDLLNQ